MGITNDPIARNLATMRMCSKKTCLKCHSFLSGKEFPRDEKSPDKRKHVCYECSGQQKPTDATEYFKRERERKGVESTYAPPWEASCSSSSMESSIPSCSVKESTKFESGKQTTSRSSISLTGPKAKPTSVASTHIKPPWET